MGMPVHQSTEGLSVAWVPDKRWPSYVLRSPAWMTVDAVLRDDADPEWRRGRLASGIYYYGLYVSDDRGDLTLNLPKDFAFITYSWANPSKTAHELAKKHYEYIKEHLVPGSKCRIEARYPFFHTRGVYEVGTAGGS